MYFGPLGGQTRTYYITSYEVGRRIALGEAAYRDMKRNFLDRKLSVYRKLQIYHACIASTVLHGLETLNITLRNIKRVEVFEHRTIRRILRIPVSMISHVSKEQVMLQSQVTQCLPNMLLYKELQLVGHLVRAPIRDPTRIVCLEPQPVAKVRKLARGLQRVGYKDSSWWFSKVLGQISRDFSNESSHDRAGWRNAIQRRCEGRVCVLA